MTNLFAVEEADFQSKVLASDVPVLVDFWATWCGPCRAIAPILEEIAQEFAGKLNIAKVNVDENSDLAAQYGIRSIPALLLFKNGKIADTVIGMQPKPRLVEFVKQHI
ncbi:MAG: thioredoxin [Cardiobacteriaceae bacterium]|nr:thioredoxin [Cardiobacteriaceae bacterium]